MSRAEPSEESIFDKVLKEQGWNISPQAEIIIPSSTRAVVNAAKAMAICAYPQTDKLGNGGKAHKYFEALMAYAFRAAKWTGRIDRLPRSATKLKIERMWDRLGSGNRNLLRSFLIRDLIHSVIFAKTQNEKSKRGELSTFTLSFSPDLHNFVIKIPIDRDEAGNHILCGEVPAYERSSLRAAIRKHSPALSYFAGPSPRIEGPDEELFYQNTLNRYVRPTLQALHILQVVWEAAIKFREEAIERGLPIDQILIRKADWAKDLHARTLGYERIAIFDMRELGIPSCSCRLVHIGPPLPDS